jgi:spore maturation protein SpmB
MASKTDEKVGVVGYLALIFAALFFSGLFTNSEGILKALDFQTYLGSYGKICEAAYSSGIVGSGGSGVREGFFQALSIAPVMIFSVAFIGCIEYLGGLKAAQKLLTPVLRPLMGVPGICGLAMIINWQSSDASSAQARELYDAGYISRKERERLVAYEFITAACIGVFFSNGAIILPYLTIPTGLMLVIVLLNKFVAANLMRLYQLIFDRKNPDEKLAVKGTGDEDTSSEQKTEKAKKPGLIQTFMDQGAVGFKLWFEKVCVAILFGYAIVQVLEVTGLMNVISYVFSPILGVLGLPGEAALAILASYMTLPAGCAIAASMVQSGTMTATQLTIMFPMMYAVSSNLLYIGRVLGAAGVESKKYPIYILIGLLCAFIGGFAVYLMV